MVSKLIRASGHESDVKPKNDKSFTLEEMQHYVDGYVEVVYFNDNTILLTNEEGRYMGLPINQKATELMKANGRSDFIVGNVIHCDRSLLR